MSINPLNDISKVYLEQVSVASRARNAVADDRLDAEQEKTNASMNRLRQQSNSNRVARADAAAAERRVRSDVKNSSAYGPQRPNPGTVTGRRIEKPKPTGSKPTGYRTESAVPGKPAERLGAVTAIPKSEQEAARERILAKTKAKREKALDPVGQEDADIDNDGDTDKTDKYLHNRRKAIGKAIAKKKSVKEGFSNWRQDLSEVMGDIEDNKQIKEKKVDNKIKINPKLGEAVEEIGGVLLEMVEIDEVDFVVESVYGELLEEGYEEDDIEEALEYALTEAKVTFGHDTDKPYQKKTGAGQLARAVGRLARQKLSSKVRGAKASAEAAVARGARKVAKGALGVARKMEGDDNKANPRSKGAKPTSAPKRPPSAAGTKERVSSGSYQAPSTTKKKAEKPSDPWEGSYKKSSEVKTKPKPKVATATATPKRKKKSKLDSLLADIRNESVEINEMPYQVMGSPDGGNEKKIGKPVKSKKYADARASELEDTHKSTGGKYRSQYVEEIEIDEDAGIISGLAGLALGARGASYAAKHSKRMRDYPKNFVKGIVDPRTYVSKKKKDQKEEIEIDEKMNLATADMADVIRDFETSNAPQFKGRTKEQRRQMAIAAKLTAERGGKKLGEQMDDSTEMSSTSPVDDKKMEQQKRKIQMQKIKDLTVRLSAARKGVY
jgi:hypothetical protein